MSLNFRDSQHFVSFPSQAFLIRELVRSQQVHLRLLCATISAHPTAPRGSWVGEVGAFVLLTVLVSTSFTSYYAFVSECSPARLATFRRRPLLDFHIHFAAKLVTTTFSGRQQRQLSQLFGPSITSFSTTFFQIFSQLFVNPSKRSPQLFSVSQLLVHPSQRSPELFQNSRFFFHPSHRLPQLLDRPSQLCPLCRS